jgi:hypothetical protein
MEQQILIQVVLSLTLAAVVAVATTQAERVALVVLAAEAQAVTLLLQQGQQAEPDLAAVVAAVEITLAAVL